MKHKNTIPLHSLEGFIRQLSWRNYVMNVYTQKWKTILKTNFFKGVQKVPAAFWEGTTGLPPVDNVILQVQKYGYAHHIQRLMILGNILVLLNYHPISILEWFMAFVSMDAYMWVMVGNIAMLGVFGDVMMTRVYVSSSNYLLKMSNYKSNSWAQIWDALFWRFVHVNKSYLQKNYATANYVKILKSKKNIKELIKLANAFSKSLT
jgi:deoxyribodipyrimidine photolyase-related protein